MNSVINYPSQDKDIFLFCGTHASMYKVDFLKSKIYSPKQTLQKL
jgi:hypothetical protein